MFAPLIEAPYRRFKEKVLGRVPFFSEADDDPLEPPPALRHYARVAIAKAYMKEQCRGIIEKQGRALNLFWRMEMVVWQERYVFLTDQALHYQKLTKQRLADTATTKAVRFCDVNKVTAQYEDCVLVLHCRQRSTFGLTPITKCESGCLPPQIGF